MEKLELLATALEYMESHLEEDVRTEDVATACFCAKSTLEKLFRRVMNTSVHDYTVRRRMMKAAKFLHENPETNLLDLALQFGYSTNESFTRAFRQVWNCNPSEFRTKARYTELYPRRLLPEENGDDFMKTRKRVDISELYDLFVQRRGCYFVCCDIHRLMEINEISMKAGDLALLTQLERLTEAAGEEDVVFRIGADEFVVLTNSKDVTYAESIAEKVRAQNGQPIVFEGKEIPLILYTGVTKLSDEVVRYNEMYAELQKTIMENKFE